jgi:hypothetical protein
MFRALLAHFQEELHERRFGDCCVRLYMWAGLGMWEDCSCVYYVIQYYGVF